MMVKASISIHFLLLSVLCFRIASAQRYLLRRLSSTRVMRADDEGRTGGLSRTMHLMQNLPWQLPALRNLVDVPDPALRSHLRKYLSRPVNLTLLRKPGKFGLRAVGQLSNGKKLRAFWRQSFPKTSQFMTSDVLKQSYEEAVRESLFTVEFELQLPPVSRRSKVLPSVVYTVSVERGNMNPKAIVPRGPGRVTIWPEGRSGSKGALAGGTVDMGTCAVLGYEMRPGLVDSTWAKGRPIFRAGRKSGLV